MLRFVPTILSLAVSVASLAVFLVACLAPASAMAQTPRNRTNTHRARMEIALDHGYGASSEGGYVEAALDVRAYAPSGIGAMLRLGGAVQGLSNAFAVDLGIAGRFDLVAGERWGLQLGGAIGPTIASGPFDAGDVMAYGGFALVHLDVWYRIVFFGIGVSGHALVPEAQSGQSERRGEPLLSIAPFLRVGVEWGL